MTIEVTVGGWDRHLLTLPVSDEVLCEDLTVIFGWQSFRSGHYQVATVRPFGELGEEPQDLSEQDEFEIFIMGPDAHEWPARAKVGDLHAEPGRRMELLIYYQEFLARYRADAPVETVEVDVTIDISWKPAWQSNLPDMYITVANGNGTDPAQLEAAIGALIPSASNIKYLGVRTHEEERSLIHADGIASEDDVRSLVTAIDQLDDALGITAITIEGS